MAILNFIPQLWSATIMDTLRKAHVFGRVCRCNFEGDIKNVGDSIKISGIGDIDVGSYVTEPAGGTDITVQKLSDAGVIMPIDTANYFAFRLDDVDALQANAPLMAAATNKAAYRLRDTADSAINTIMKAQNTLTTTTDASVDTTTIIGDVAEMYLALDEVNVPDEEKWIILAPWMVVKLQLAGIVHADDLKGNINGFVGNQLGFDIYKSNNLTVTAPLAGSYGAVAFVEQIIKTEAYRVEKRFADAVKGLHVFGIKVVKPNELVEGNWTETAETAI